MDRKAEILKIAKRDGYISIDTIANMFSVTAQTARRDINELAVKGEILRQHGGASLPSTSSTENTRYAIRHQVHGIEKATIAHAVASSISDGSSVFLTSGTTVDAVAKELCRRKRLTIVTNSISAALILDENETFDVFLSGGKKRKTISSLIGKNTIDFISQFRCDYLVTSVGGLQSDGSLLEFDHAETMVAKAMMESARSVFLALDSSKFNRPASVLLGNLRDVDTLYTDSKPPVEIEQICTSSDVKIVVANSPIAPSDTSA